MKVTIAPTPTTVPVFQQREVTIKLETPEDYSALTKMAFYSGSIPTILRKDGPNYSHNELTEPEINNVQRFLRDLHIGLR